MSSSAFFIEAAANTVRLLSCDSAGVAAVPRRMVKAAKSPARRCIVALHAYSRAHFRRAQIRRWLKMDATGGSGVPRIPATYGRSGYRSKNNSRLRAWVKASLVYSDGRIATDTESSLVPLTCSTNGLAEISYFMVLRMPSQSVAPLKAFGLRKCPSCTTSTQPPAERLIVYRPALGAFLKLAKPAKVPSFGARSGGEGSLAS